MAPVSFTMVSYAVLDCRFKGIYRLIALQKYAKASIVINDTLRSIKNAAVCECAPKFMDFVISELYRMLIDLAFHRYDSLHEHIRMLHYTVLEILMPDNENDEIPIDYIDYDTVAMA